MVDENGNFDEKVTREKSAILDNMTKDLSEKEMTYILYRIMKSHTNEKRVTGICYDEGDKERPYFKINADRFEPTDDASKDYDDVLLEILNLPEGDMSIDKIERSDGIVNILDNYASVITCNDIIYMLCGWMEMNNSHEVFVVLRHPITKVMYFRLSAIYKQYLEDFDLAN